MTLVRRVDAVTDTNEPHAPMHEASARLLRLHTVAAQPTEIVHQHDVKLIGLGVREQLLIALAFAGGAADGLIFIRAVIVQPSREARCSQLRNWSVMELSFLVLG